MRAMILTKVVSLQEVDTPLRLVDLPIPVPEAGEVLIRVSACGVCHTELDEIEGRAAPAYLPMVLGHEVVGRIERIAPDVTERSVGDRVGVGWIYCSNGEPDENLSTDFRATGRDAYGGYAEYIKVPAEYTYPIPAQFTDAQAAPLLCAGAIGYRALKLTNLADGDLLGLAGFGGSAHLVLQLVQHLYPNTQVFVFARDARSQDFARSLGAVWAGDSGAQAPQLLHAIIDTTPAWKPVVDAMKNLRPGGRLVINAIRKEDTDKPALLELRYHDHLWMEKEIKSVANITRQDISLFLSIAATIPLKPEIQTFALEDANRALLELKHGLVRGAKVLLMS